MTNISERLCLLPEQNVCCHCLPPVIQSDFNTPFRLIDFRLPQTVWNEILFFFSPIRGNYPTMRAACRSVLGALMFVKCGFLYSLSVAAYKICVCVCAWSCAVEIRQWDLQRMFVYFNRLTHPPLCPGPTMQQKLQSQAGNGCWFGMLLFSLSPRAAHIL